MSDDEEEDVYFLLRCRCGAVLAPPGDEGITAGEAAAIGWDAEGSRCPACRRPEGKR